MLTYNQYNEVEFIKPADKLDASVKLINEYKNDEKLLKNILVYVYNAYSPQSIYYEFTPQERKERVCTDLFDDKIKAEYFENNKLIKEFIQLFVDMSLTVIQRDHERCKRDIEDLHEHISQIPFMRKQKVRRQITIKDDDTEKEFIKEIDIVVDIDNSEEKKKALDIREKLYSLDSRLRKLVETEKIEKELTAKTMFEV